MARKRQLAAMPEAMDADLSGGGGVSIIRVGILAALAYGAYKVFTAASEDDLEGG